MHRVFLVSEDHVCKIPVADEPQTFLDAASLHQRPLPYDCSRSVNCPLNGLTAMDGLDSDSVVRGFARKLGRVPQPLRKSLTYGQGREMARHEYLVSTLSLKTYFADPHSPWQRGSNENTNGLLR
jgi:hypothetical protein